MREWGGGVQKARRGLLSKEAALQLRPTTPSKRRRPPTFAAGLLLEASGWDWHAVTCLASVTADLPLRQITSLLHANRL